MLLATPYPRFRHVFLFVVRCIRLYCFYLMGQHGYGPGTSNQVLLGCGELSEEDCG